MGCRLVCLLAIAIAFGCGPDSRTSADAALVPDAPVDARPASGEFAEACTQHVDCRLGYCVEPNGGAGGVCSRTCEDDCPTGWDCLPVEFPPGPIRLCIPADGRLCAPCANDGECPSNACLALDGEGRCATPCSAATDCPTGYTCGPDAAGTHAGSFCQPVTASCSCSAEMAGAMRSCAESNTIATCWGTQTCVAATGWSSCTAITPAVETCDGVDNDCNFLIDDQVGGGEACTISNAQGACPGVRTCDGAAGFTCHGPTPMAEICNAIDDNCNGTIDEGFPGLGDLCSAGLGACLRYGSMQCTAGGTGTVCSAVAAPPAAELCNQIDDDCNGSVDETFTTLGELCSVGAGVCERYGTQVCRADATGVACSATAGPPAGAEVCNYLDDDCDGILDNGFRNPVTTFYDSDLACGACGNDCTVVFAGAPSAFGRCMVAGTPRCVMQCNAGTFDLNTSTLDGCEFALDAAAIYVSGNDVTAIDDAGCGLGPSGTGTGHHPCRTIAHGLSRVSATGRARVLIADATYAEPVTLVNGKSLLGGYRADTWERHLATTSTVIQGVLTTGAHDRTVISSAITLPTVFEGFVVRGSPNVKPSGNSYAVYVTGSTSNLTIRDNQIFGGRGGPGAAGAPGVNGTTGASGAAYTAAFDAFQATGTGACSTTNNRTAAGGGVRTCASDDVGGGNGGGNNCTPLVSTQNSTATSVASAGQPGAGAGGGTGGAPGARGWDADLNGNTCFLPFVGGTGRPVFGADGNPGGGAINATGVAGCTSAGGAVIGGHWVGGAGSAGALAANGGGGGGGGAGGGSTCTGCTVGTGKAMLGGRGGGAGTGGCGGTGGNGGSAGGAAFAIFVVGGASAPAIMNNVVALGDGGAGGAGGIGGAGGLGGLGGEGGQVGALFCTGKGGRGGDGGNGGAGSGGGGGCGGSSHGIFTSGLGAPAYCAANQVSGGSGGPAGSGGYSGGNQGGAGQPGAVGTCTAI